MHERTDSWRQMHWEDGVVYAATLVGIYLLFGVLFFYSAKSKLIDGHGAPPGIVKQFQGTFVSTFPGIDAIWWFLGILADRIFVLLLVSLVRLEFLPERRKQFLLSGLGVALFTFAVLATGQNITGQTTGVAELFLYVGATAVLMLIVLRLPPYGGLRWISGRRPGRSGADAPESA